MHQQVTNNRYYEKFLGFRGALREFFFRLSAGDFAEDLKTLLTLKFDIVSPIKKRLPLPTRLSAKQFALSIVAERGRLAAQRD